MKHLLEKAPIAGISFAVLTALTQVGCGGGSTAGNPQVSTEDSSASGAAAGAAGGAVSGTESSGTLAFLEAPYTSTFMSRLAEMTSPLPFSFASDACATYKSTGTSCSASGTSLWLNYAGCSFLGGSASWTGTQGLFMSSGNASCGTFPSPGASGTLYRQFVSSAGSTTPSSVQITSAYGTVATIDNSSANLSNFDSDSIPTLIHSGYGSSASFVSAAIRNSVTVAQRIYVAGSFDHSISGTLTFTESGGSTMRTLNGTLKVYHNLLRVVGNSTFTNVVHKDGCCLPVSGTIETVFSAGNSVTPTAAGELVVGKTETLTLTGCGTGTLQTYDGNTLNVALTRCF